MRKFAVTTVLVPLAGFVASIKPAVAAPLDCHGPIKAEVSGRFLTGAYDVPASVIKRDQHEALAVARQNAIAAWRGKVAAHCPGLSTSWLRAQDRSADVCDQAMGGRFTFCVAARPVKKRWQFG